LQGGDISSVTVNPWQFQVTLAQFDMPLGKAAEGRRSPRRIALFGCHRISRQRFGVRQSFRLRGAP
jgi:hypothetical protein